MGAGYFHAFHRDGLIFQSSGSPEPFCGDMERPNGVTEVFYGESEL